MTQTTLDTLTAGSSGTIVRYDGDPPIRLLEMGLVPGTPVEVVRLAPLGDPMDLRVRGFHLSVRKAEAGHVVIEVAS